MDTTIAQEVKNRFARIMHLDAGQLDMEARLDDAYGVTSMNSMRLISELEVEYGLEIPEDKIRSICTLSDVVRLCENGRG